ncbi:hypothetical protein BFG60_1517 [Microcystis aeruginosa NIES-98]|nr:hypothetical protein BFG60_1517 [Microcystis aeruginosa NIES-98]
MKRESQYLGYAAKSFSRWPSVGFYLIFREKVPEFSPQSLQWSALFEGKKV